MIERNAVIKKTMLGWKDAPAFTWELSLDRGDGYQAFGHWVTYKNTEDSTGSFVTALLTALELECWEQLTGTVVRIRVDDNDMIVGIGHYIVDKWFMAKDFFERKTQ